MITDDYSEKTLNRTMITRAIQRDSKYVFAVGTVAANASRVANILEKMITYVRKIQFLYQD